MTFHTEMRGRPPATNTRLCIPTQEHSSTQHGGSLEEAVRRVGEAPLPEFESRLCTYELCDFGQIA